MKVMDDLVNCMQTCHQAKLASDLCHCFSSHSYSIMFQSGYLLVLVLSLFSNLITLQTTALVSL